MFEVDAVEARGDAAGALRLIEAMPLGPDGRPWWRPSRIRRLQQVVDLGESAPAWVWAKWVVSQAAQSTPGDPVRAVEVATATRGGRRTLWGVDQVDAQAKVMDHDWVYRQLVLHEYAGLAAYLEQRAGQDLVRRAAGIDGWASAPMRALELVGEEATRIQWLDLASLEVVETINLGAAAMLADGECVIGRVVEADGTTLFESAPLCVPRDVARRVAAEPGEWLAVLADACRDATSPILVHLVSRFHEFDLLCDLPPGIRRQVVQPEDPDLGSDQIGTGGNGSEYDVALVLAALADEIDVEGDDDDGCSCGQDHSPRPLASLVAAALVEPGTVEALRPLLVPSDGRALMRLCRVLPEPADQVCRRLAIRVADAA
ncbi:hypothetical protein C7S10_01415 [Nocardioides currus]|uniref:Uncharacterized protein n=2 Tax=Nocardioides currus TaxID=2133958 RepID=A0A2R7Z1D6_9ACTN|nr:hypothetical protein C7S10_01415 [Nocardioides currus]